MLIGWSKHQVSDDPLQPSKYMLDVAVEKEFADGRRLEVRTPVPELLVGHPAVFQASLKVAKTVLRYRVATMSFAAEDIDVEAFNSGDVESRKAISIAIDLFLEMAFAGIPIDHRPPVLVGTHTHTGRLEINIAIPRYVIHAYGKVRSFNPHPPSSNGRTDFWDSSGDFLNNEFEWANPRAAGQASQIKGPDWAEKRVAAADRVGQTFDPEIHPRLFLLQSAKSIVRQHHGKSPATFWGAFGAAIKLTEYRSTPDEKGRLWFTSLEGEPLLLKGELINSPKSYCDTTGKLDIKQDIDTLWKRRAGHNSKAFSGSAWDEPAPIWAAYSSRASIQLPAHHPDFDPPAPDGGGSNFISLASRLSAALRAVRSVLTQRVVGFVVRSGLASLQPNLFKTIKHQLENLENECPGTKNVKNDEPDDRPVRSAAEGVGEGGRDGHRRAYRRDDGRPERDQRADGALYEGDGSFGSGNERTEVGDRDATRDESTARGTGPRHQMASPATEPIGLSRVKFLADLRRATDLVFPKDEVSIGMTVDGCFRISLPRGDILVSRERGVVGTQSISENEVMELVNALPEAVLCKLTPPEDRDAPEFF